MRVLLVNHSSAENELGGAERSLLALGEEWARREPGLEIEVVTASAEGEFARAVRSRGWQLFAVEFWPWAIPHLYRPGENRFDNARRDGRAVLAIEKRIRDTSPDLVVTNSVVNPWGAVAAGLTGTPHVWFAREFGDLDHGLQFVIGVEQSWHDVGLLSDLVVANSEAVRAHAESFLPGREVLVTYPPVDVETLRTAPVSAEAGSVAAQATDARDGHEGTLDLLMVGTVGPAKRQHLAVEALGELRARGVDARLTLVGPLDHPEYHSALLDTAARLGVADRVRVEGYREDPRPYIRDADVALMLSRSEAFGRVTLEYLAQGTPVVGIDAGGTSELIADGSSGFVTSAEVSDIADALARYAADPALLRAHAAAAPGDAAAVAGRYPLSDVIAAMTELARTAPRVPKLPHLTEFWIGLADDVELMRDEWQTVRNPTLDDTVRQFEEARVRSGRAGTAASAALAAGAEDLSPPPPVTIVVPVYGDLPSLERCVQSVLEHGGLPRNRLLLVNDVGPDADAIETRLLELIDGVENAFYARNPKNLGFGSTCNRAAFELDDSGNDVLLLNSDAVLLSGAVEELARVLHAGEKHGVVCPRSNHATIASFPFVSRPRRGPDDIEHSLRKFASLRDELPRYTVAPVAIGFCFLVRRSLLDQFGLFDEVFNPGYGEEVDFCLRINTHGYSSLFANHAYVIHEGSRSFSESEFDSDGLRTRNEELIFERYPHFRSSIDQYLEHDIDPIDWFADFIDGNDPDKRVLIDLYDLTLRYDGTSRNALSFLTLLSEKQARGELDAEFVIASSIEAQKFFGLDRFGFRSIWNHDVNELFDLGIALVPLGHEKQILRFNRFCARWVVTHLDIIGTRLLSLRENDAARKQVLRDSLAYADRTVAISQATVDDTLAYFPEVTAEARSRITVVHQGAARVELEAKNDGDALSERQRAAVAAAGYVLVVGNSYPHKQLAETVDALRGGGRPVVVFGGEFDDRGDEIVPIRGGLLSDRQVSRLYAGASVVVFPSAYEGFGLPIAEAAKHGKPVVLFDTEVAHEVVDGLGLGDGTVFFSRFAELPAAVTAAEGLTVTVTPDEVRSLDDYNARLLEIVDEELALPVDLARLRRRFLYFRSVAAYTARIAERFAEASYDNELIRARRAYKVVEAVDTGAARARQVRGQVQELGPKGVLRAIKRRLPGGKER
ncbi:glycosyltransferase [Herbiconiux sp. KACC 21604]|uniref:glycosyltransferase n=1 Tax=unclassified Herbiconiux TaxID=2618217 RepID=UPI001491C8FF|nr:glycosyltransferase [Herbiconiux sp. SALV-R1]QJU54427.1 glycosyltransferase [Herbiconiux sp. SALV-R1]WPO85502.1 glycosyltransferase [Herbiconiux sp. KACC 21604]